jgi:hypothetical protein
MGALLEPLTENKKAAADMSVQFVKLATDLGSFNNVPTDEALLAIRSGLVGEAEPLRRFSVLLNEAAVKNEALRLGLVKGKEALTEQQKVQARASLIMQQTTLAQGDAARTADSFANQLKRLKSQVSDTATELGMKLLPMASAVLGAVNTAAAGVGNFIDKLSAAKGLEAKVSVVLDTGADLAQKAVKIGQDVGKQISSALAGVNWTDAGNKISMALGDAFRKGIPTLAKLGSTLNEAFRRAIQEADWVAIGAAIGKGIKDGTEKAAKEQIKKGLVNSIQTASPFGVTAAIEVGRDIGNRLAGALGKTNKEKIPEAMSPVPAMIAAGADPAIAVARSSGGRIGFGLSGGLTAALSGVGASVAATIISQINMTELQLKQKYGIHSPSTRWARELGEPLAQGIVMGMDGGLALLAPKMKAKIDAAIARAKAVVDAARGRMEASFSLLSDKLLRAFDAETSGFRTAAEMELDTINARRQAEQLQKALNDALASGDQEAIARAREDIHMASLETTAAAERKAYEDQRNTMRENLENRLTLLGQHFKAEGATVSAALAAITRLMNKYGITFEEAGAYIGKSFMFGLQQAVGGAAATAGGVRGAQTGGNVRPMPPIVTQVVLDSRVIAESVRDNNVVYQKQGGFLAV